MKKITLMPDTKLPEVRIGNAILKDGRMFSMKQYLNAKTSSYPPFGKGLDGPEQGMRIRSAYNGANGAFNLEEEDYKVLVRSIEEVDLAPEIAMYGLIFGKAVMNAETIEIEEKGKVPNKKGK